MVDSLSYLDRADTLSVCPGQYAWTKTGHMQKK